MKLLTCLFVCTALTILYSCGGSDNGEKPGEAKGTNPNDTVFSGDFYYDTLKGLYLGEIGDSPLTLAISFISEKHATGYNMTKGNKRNISGSVALKKETVDFVLNEPGDHQYDGVFRLSMNLSDLSTLTGEWESPSGEVKMVKLKRKIFDENSKESFGLNDIHVSDSLADMYLNADGSCRYEYYVDKDQSTEQLKKIKGSWKKIGETIVVYWEQNTIFKSKTSTFKISRETPEMPDYSDQYYYPVSLIGEGREFNELMY